MSWRKTEQHQCYMDFAPVLLYLVAVIMRQARCQSACSSETVFEVSKLLRMLPAQDDSKLYTPTENYFMNCSKSILECFTKEATVLIAETNGKPQPLLKMLKNLARQLKDKRPPCPACEVYNEEPPVTFLHTLLHILKKMNSDNCSG